MSPFAPPDRSQDGYPALFTRGEYVARQEKLRLAASDTGLDAVVVWSRGGGTYDQAGTLVWLANYYPQFPIIGNQLPAWSGRGHGVAVLPVAGEPTLIVDAPYHRPDLAAIDDIRESPNVLDTLVDVLQGHTLQHARIGLAGEKVLPWVWGQYVAERLPGIIWQPADLLLDRVRRIKSPAEQALLRRAASACMAATDAMLGMLEPGRSEGEIVGAALETLARQGAVLTNIGLTSGPWSHTYARARMPGWDPGRILARGDLLRFDMVGQFEGYLFDIGRTGVAGAEPTSAQRALIDGARETVWEVIRSIRPGVTASQLAAVGQRALAEARYHELEHPDLPGRSSGFAGFGHALGAGNEEPWLMPGEDTVIEPGMALAVEKTVGIPGVGGASWEENLLVTEDGVEVMTVDPHPWV